MLSSFLFQTKELVQLSKWTRIKTLRGKKNKKNSRSLSKKINRILVYLDFFLSHSNNLWILIDLFRLLTVSVIIWYLELFLPLYYFFALFSLRFSFFYFPFPDFFWVNWIFLGWRVFGFCCCCFTYSTTVFTSISRPVALCSKCG